jgi:hypothetical protein
MLHTHPSSKAYSPEELAILQQAFDSVWAMLYSHVYMDDEATVKKLNMALSDAVLSLAAEGITDPLQLKRKAAEHMLLTSF